MREATTIDYEFDIEVILRPAGEHANVSMIMYLPFGKDLPLHEEIHERIKSKLNTQTLLDSQRGAAAIARRHFIAAIDRGLEFLPDDDDYDDEDDDEDAAMLQALRTRMTGLKTRIVNGGDERVAVSIIKGAQTLFRSRTQLFRDRTQIGTNFTCSFRGEDSMEAIKYVILLSTLENPRFELLMNEMMDLILEPHGITSIDRRPHYTSWSTKIHNSDARRTQNWYNPNAARLNWYNELTSRIWYQQYESEGLGETSLIDFYDIHFKKRLRGKMRDIHNRIPVPNHELRDILRDILKQQRTRPTVDLADHAAHI